MKRLSLTNIRWRSLRAANCYFVALIHRSAWKGNSANFVITEFSEIRSWGTELEEFIGNSSLSIRLCVRYVGKRETSREGAGPLPVLLLDQGASYPTDYPSCLEAREQRGEEVFGGFP